MTQLDADETPPDFRLDSDWWRKLILMKKPNGGVKYSLLGALSKAILSIFSGPLVEGTFTIMDDIIEQDQTRMLNENDQAIALIKSHYKSKNETSLIISIAQSMRLAVRSATQRQIEWHNKISERVLPFSDLPHPSSAIISIPVSAASVNIHQLSKIPGNSTSLCYLSQYPHTI